LQILPEVPHFPQDEFKAQIPCQPQLLLGNYEIKRLVSRKNIGLKMKHVASETGISV
jgi:hypothetical protein